MKKEIIAEGVEIYCGDCLEIISTLSGVDHIISDPPYEDELHETNEQISKRKLRKDGGNEFVNLGFGGINASRNEVARNLVESCQGWVILFCLAEGVRAWRDEIQLYGGKWDTTLFWVKPDAAPRFNGQGAARGAECAITAWCGKGYRSWNGGGRRGVFTHNVNTNRDAGGHPTEKPVPLMLDLVYLYSNTGQTICDPFAGSGTTGVACVKLGRKFIGIEKDPKWFDLACKRVSKEIGQADLFVERPGKAKQLTIKDLIK